MPYQFYHIIHLFCLFTFMGLTFSAFANPHPSRKKFIMRSTGIVMFIAFVAGFGLAARTGYSLTSFWILVKIGVWVLACALPVVPFRLPQLNAKGQTLLLVLFLLAIVMVSLKPNN